MRPLRRRRDPSVLLVGDAVPSDRRIIPDVPDYLGDLLERSGITLVIHVYLTTVGYDPDILHPLNLPAQVLYGVCTGGTACPLQIDDRAFFFHIENIILPPCPGKARVTATERGYGGRQER
jgi:hypothetical protein